MRRTRPRSGLLQPLVLLMRPSPVIALAILRCLVGTSTLFGHPSYPKGEELRDADTLDRDFHMTEGHVIEDRC